MPNYAVHDGRIITNVIVADAATIAELVTGLSAIETDGVPWLNWELVNGTWVHPRPVDGVWEWSQDLQDWVQQEVPTPPGKQPL